MPRLIEIALVTLFCSLSALSMAALGMVTMDNPETASLSPICFFVAFVLVAMPFIDVLEHNRHRCPRCRKDHNASRMAQHPHH
jgi:hypothetical protein